MKSPPSGFLPLAALWKRSVKPCRACSEARLPWPAWVAPPSGLPPPHCCSPAVSRCRCSRQARRSASVRPRRPRRRSRPRLRRRPRARQGRARARRPRLGPRPRARPVGHLRLREARLELRQDPRATTTPARRSGRPSPERSGCCSLGEAGDAELRRRRGASRTQAGGEAALDPGTVDARESARGRRTARAAAAVRLHIRTSRSSVDGTPYRGQARRRRRREARAGDRHRRARAVPEGRRPGGDAVGLGAGGVEGAGGRGPLVRAGEPHARARRSTSTGTRATRRTVA